MMLDLRKMTGAVALVAGVSLSGWASAQPLNVLVNPLAVPGAILSAPFAALSPGPANAYDPAPARAAAVGYTGDLHAIVEPHVLRATGPRYDNPARARDVVVVRPGSTVPGYVTTAPLENVSVAGLAPGAHYAFFVSPDQHVVVLEPSTRRVVRILR